MADVVTAALAADVAAGVLVSNVAAAEMTTAPEQMAAAMAAMRRLVEWPGL